MKKKFLFGMSLLFMFVIFSGCSSREADELVELQNDMKEHVAEPMFAIAYEFEAKGEELDSGDLTPREFVEYYEAEIEPSIMDMKEYMNDYATPETEDASEYFTVLTEGLDLALQVLEQSATLVSVLVDDEASEADLFELAEETEELGEKLDKKDEEVLQMQEKLQEKYDVEFEEINLED